MVHNRVRSKELIDYEINSRTQNNPKPSCRTQAGIFTQLFYQGKSGIFLKK
jgi:hypothetical protein